VWADGGVVHRLNTYPLIHTGWIHALLNVIAVTPLLERFEREVGTLKTTLLIAGPLVTFPAGLYLGIEMFVLRGSQAVMGARYVLFPSQLKAKEGADGGKVHWCLPSSQLRV